MGKAFEYFFVTLLAGSFLGAMLSSILGLMYGMIAGWILTFISFRSFCKDEESSQKKRDYMDKIS